MLREGGGDKGEEEEIKKVKEWEEEEGRRRQSKFGTQEQLASLLVQFSLVGYKWL